MRKVHEVDCEITSFCNLTCVLCERYHRVVKSKEKIPIKHWTVDDINWLANEGIVNEVYWSLSGGVSDPMGNPDFISIVDALLSHNAKTVYISTNATLGTEETWRNIAILTNKLGGTKIRFVVAIDGSHQAVNEKYRIGSDYEIIERNLNIFKQYEGKGGWQFIQFGHNIDDVMYTKKKAQEYGFHFYIHNTRKINDVLKVTEEVKQHISQDTYNETHNKLKQVIAPKQTTKQTKHIEKQIKERLENPKGFDCMHVNERKTIAITYNFEMWPCCYHYRLNKEDDMKEFFNNYSNDWNNIKKHGVAKVFEHPYFAEHIPAVLRKEEYIRTCFHKCGKNV